MRRTLVQRLTRWMRGVMLNHMPWMITCREFEDFLLDYLEGNLPRGQRRIFDLHLAICRECRDYLAAYKETMALGKRAFDDPEAALPENVPEDLVTAVLEARRPDSEK